MSEEQPRDDHGRWTNGGGGGGLAAWAHKAAGRLAGPMVAKATKDGGFTYRPGDPKATRSPKDGIMVSRAPDEGHGHVIEIAKLHERVPPPTAKEVRETVAKQASAWLDKSLVAMKKLGSDHYLGGWMEKDSKGDLVALHLDVSQRFDPRHKEQAVAAGRARNQMAVYDLGKGEEIPTGGTGR